jgi:carnitine O-palmitoyltransferase 1, liver isoform
VRPVTRESCQFVRTMQDPSATAKHKLEALRKAAGRHVRGYTDAMCGRGIDRHLFALYVVSVGKAIDSPFLKSALAVPWKLSTSQQPQQQTNLWDIKDPKNARRISPGGGFGPVSEDGYGVSYMVRPRGRGREARRVGAVRDVSGGGRRPRLVQVSGEREIFFHVSSIKSATGTDSGRFADRIFAALAEMREVLSVALKDEDAAAAAKAGSAKGEAGGKK